MTYNDWQQRQMDSASGDRADRVERDRTRLHPLFRSILDAHSAPKPLDRTCPQCGALPGYVCSTNCPAAA